MAHEEVKVGAPLFDRLVDLDPESKSEAPPFRALDRAGLRESVRRELQRLFNTRCSLPADRLEERPRSVIDYGIPDFVDMTPGNPEHRSRIAAILVRTIEAFEPRLRQVSVELGEFSKEAPGLQHLHARDAALVKGGPRALWARVEAVLEVGSVREPISFPAVIRGEPGASEVYEPS